jgi:TRAP transporter TAXI family solute receptor
MKLILLSVFIFFSFMANAFSKIKSNATEINLYSGDKSGTFFIKATEICDKFNYNASKKGLNYICKVKESKGSLENLYHIKKDKNSFSIIKSPEFYQHVSNIDYDFKEIKIVRKTHDEFLTVLVNKRSQIQSLTDLNNKRINIGYIGSSSRIITEKYLNDFKIKPVNIFAYGAGESFKQMESNDLDAWVYFNGHPNPRYSKILIDDQFDIISLSKSEIANFVAIGNFFKENILDLKPLYGINRSIQTISSETFLATNDTTSVEIINLMK